jgi:dTDP-4-amino-4,6-dideoxygalactose transaminase
MSWRIPLSDLDFGEEEKAALERVLTSRWLSMGPEVEAFEAEFAATHGARFACAVSNGTAALHLALLACKIGEGDEVIQPGINFVASANITIACGATPVFVDICGLDEPIIDSRLLEKSITSSTRAVIVMHYGGNLCRMDEIASLCATRGISLIEDACHAIAAVPPNDWGFAPEKRAGVLGDVGAFSFFANKNLATGEGGMVITDHEHVARAVRSYRSHGMTSLTWDRHRGHASAYDVTDHGFNYRFDELRAAIGRAQLRKVEANNAKRRKVLARYKHHFAGKNDWKLAFADRIERSAAHLAVAIAPDADARLAAATRLRGAGVQTSMHYPCITGFSGFSKWRDSPLPVSTEFARRAITLPLYPAMDDSCVDLVMEVLAEDFAAAEDR